MIIFINLQTAKWANKITKRTNIFISACSSSFENHKQTRNIWDLRHGVRPRKQYSRWKTHQAYFPQPLSPRYTICFPEMPVQKWSSQMGCSQKAIPPTCQQGQATQPCMKTCCRNWGAERKPQVLWTNESKFERFGRSRCSLLAEGLESGTIMSVCRPQQSMVEVPCIFGAGLVLFSLLRHTGRYLSCSATMISPKCILQKGNDPKHIYIHITIYISLRTTFSVKRNTKSWN